ncbi:MAG: hypothetical protein ACOYNS_01995 [Bacteroidota bacterium]
MKQIFLFAAFIFSVSLLTASEPEPFKTQWLSSKPEVLTYSSTSKQGNGLYQISFLHSDSLIEIYMNIITTGFTKTVSGTMNADLTPVQSLSKIIVNGQIVMDTRCNYEKQRLHITTLMRPFNRVMKNDPEFTGRVFDFSQSPFVPRALDFSVRESYSFQMLNPQTNQITPYSLKRFGVENVKGIDCYKVESNDFEGRSILWIEKGDARRVIRIEQPETGRISELIL